MKRLTRSLRRTAVLTVLAGVFIFLTACSKDYTSKDYTAPMGSGSESSPPPSEFRYLELTPEFLEQALPPGYHVPSLPGALDEDESDTMAVSVWCQSDQNRVIKITHFIQLRYYRNLMSTSATIQIVMPNDRLPVADFYPHPTQFSGNVQVKFLFREMGFDETVDPETMVVMYYHEDTGKFELISFEWEGDYGAMVVETDHFSRYIVAQRIRG